MTPAAAERRDSPVRVSRSDGLTGAATTSTSACSARAAAGEARRYPAVVNSGATTICPRDVVLNRISFTGW
jgi:hypothetical protein